MELFAKRMTWELDNEEGLSCLFFELEDGYFTLSRKTAESYRPIRQRAFSVIVGLGFISMKYSPVLPPQPPDPRLLYRIQRRESKYGLQLSLCGHGSAQCG